MIKGTSGKVGLTVGIMRRFSGVPLAQMYPSTQGPRIIGEVRRKYLNSSKRTFPTIPGLCMQIFRYPSGKSNRRMWTKIQAFNQLVCAFSIRKRSMLRHGKCTTEPPITPYSPSRNPLITQCHPLSRPGRSQPRTCRMGLGQEPDWFITYI